MRNTLRNELVILTLAAVATLGISCKKKAPTTENKTGESYEVVDNHKTTKEADSPYGLYTVVSSTQVDHKGNTRKEFDIREREMQFSEYIEIREGEYLKLRPTVIFTRGEYKVTGKETFYSSSLGPKREIEGGLRWGVIGDRFTSAIEMRKKSREIYEIKELPKKFGEITFIREVKKEN